MDDQRIEQLFEAWNERESAPAVTIDKMQLSLKNRQLALAIVVFEGGNYIPPSIREHLATISPWMEPGEELLLDEVAFQVVLIHKTPLPCQKIEFIHLVESYLDRANYWTWVLNEYGQRDLVPVARQ